MDQKKIEPRTSIGRIEVTPEALITIVRQVVHNSASVVRMVTPPSNKLFSRDTREEGIVLRHENSQLVFDIYVLMDPHDNIRQACRDLQKAIAEAIDHMVGIPVEAVNIYVEDVTYTKNVPV